MNSSGALALLAWATPLIGPAFLLLLRIFPVIVFTPVFGGTGTPVRFRMALALALVLILLPVATGAGPLREGGAVYVALAFKEALLGITFALIVQAIFEMLAAAGGLVDLASGALNTNAFVFDPLSRGRDSLLAAFHRRAILALFASAGGISVLLGAVADSLAAVPLTTLQPPILDRDGALIGIASLLGGLFQLAVRFAAPALALFFILDVVLALMDRAVRTVPVYILGASVKPWIGLLASLVVFAEAEEEMVREWMARLLAAVRGG